MQPVDTLIHARWIIPVVPEETVLEHHSLAIADGHIVALLPTAETGRRFQAKDEITLDQHALIPGLINAHTHSPMSLFRGLADDLPLMDWLQHHIWPAEMKWVNSDFVRDGTRLAMAEMLLGGTTCFCDMYFFPEDIAHVALEQGMRVAVGLIQIDFPSAYAQTAEEYLAKGVHLHDDLRNTELATTVFAPHAPYTVSDGPLGKIRTFADELDIPITMHIHETAHEVAEAVSQHGERPLARLERLGLVTPRLLAVHMTQLTDDEIEMLAREGATVVHCPESNLKLASGFCPVHRLMQAGVNVALGTDGAASNNDLDMLSEMRTAALLAKGVANDATALPAAAALRMATLNGARALGIDDRTGSLEAGKAADITAINLGTLASQPLYDPVSQIVYTTSRDQVSDVWVAGRQLVKDHQLTRMDSTTLLRHANDWRAKIAAADGEHNASLADSQAN